MKQAVAPQDQFVGAYVNDVVAVLTASLIGRQNVVLVGPPGCGKTQMALSFSHQVVGKDATSLIRMHPAATPDIFLGAVDPMAFTQGKMVRLIEGTPFDPKCKFAIIDEFPRSNEAAFDGMLFVADRVDEPMAPPVVGTANFAPTGDRVAALNDRFAIWLYIDPGTIDASAMSRARLSAYKNGRPDPQVNVSHLPTATELEQIWTAVPGPNAITAICSFTEALTTEARQSGYIVNNRRNAQWTDMLFRLGMWYSGMDSDFTTIPNEAAYMMRYAWPSRDAVEAKAWANVAMSVVDTVQSAIDTTMAQVLNVMNEVTAADPNQRGNKIMDATRIMASAEQTLNSIAKGDARVDEAIMRMKTWLGQAAQGKPVQ